MFCEIVLSFRVPVRWYYVGFVHSDYPYPNPARVSHYGETAFALFRYVERTTSILGQAY
jgi:hypothetical protein